MLLQYYNATTILQYYYNTTTLLLQYYYNTTTTPRHAHVDADADADRASERLSDGKSPQQETGGVNGPAVIFVFVFCALRNDYVLNDRRRFTRLCATLLPCRTPCRTPTVLRNMQDGPGWISYLSKKGCVPH